MSLGLLPCLISPAVALASPSLDVHLEAAAARPVGAEKTAQFDWGGSGVVSPELVLDRVIGLELSLGALALSDGAGMDPPGVAPTSFGFAAFSTVGPRIRPFAPLNQGEGAFQADGLWLAGGAGAGLTGSYIRPTLSASLGYDLRAAAVAAGPFLGFFQMVEPNDAIRPEDARIVMFGLHGSISTKSKTSGDHDRDGDGIADSKDACPDAAEDRDGFEDSDGCPDLDDDHDGIPDAQDDCKNVPEDKDGFEDADGCPEDDNDHDGISDAKDACPNDAEDVDGFQDTDGCPDFDDDRDGFPDAIDQCPLEPETVNGIADADGCPDSVDVEVSGDVILLEDRVHFEIDLAVVSLRSLPLLKHLADFLRDHPEYAVVHVEGHTDDTGPLVYNDKLSRARAEAVRDVLVGFGVGKARLTVDSFGPRKPRQAGASAAARTENRRVEFEILERAPVRTGEVDGDDL